MGTDAVRFFSMIRRQSYAVLRSDALVWSYLQEQQDDEISFERQAIVGTQLVDLYCPAANLVVELDAPEVGTETMQYQRRISDIERTGAYVMRFAAGDASQCPEHICDAIIRECARRVGTNDRATPPKQAN